MKLTWDALTRFWAEQQELSERRHLLDRPWEERFLHWAWEDGGYVLHGELLPSSRRRMSTTRGGWCRRAAGRPSPHPPR
ncbi:hypothetical protein WCD74_05250 [Actinomycetospora sp. OC33-EN08]|uniref:Uncharacterized protein n=1 Tax=Actinomycetospora aurantiaca TaxID=3129233 RepID=A0ABU8MIX5_9PSEU